MEASEYGLTRGTCFVKSRLEVVAIAGLLWISWCFLGGADFSCFFFFERTRPAASIRPPCLIYLSTSNTGAVLYSSVLVPVVLFSIDFFSCRFICPNLFYPTKKTIFSTWNRGCPNLVFRHQPSSYSTLTLPTGGGVSDTVPSPKRHTKFYVNQTQGTVESRPPLLYKIEHGGR